MTKIKQVFICHDTEDAKFAHRLADDLPRLGVQVWIAPESIGPGESWVSAVERGLEESSHMVVVLTPAALESEWVKKETEVAIAQERKRRIRVIPLDVEPCQVPLLLSSYQMVSFHRDYEAGLSQLEKMLGLPVAVPEAAPTPTPVFEKGRFYYAETHEWVRGEGDLATAGISDYAQAQLSDVVYVELPEVGDAFAQGEAIATVESVKTAAGVYMPIGGEITAVNEELSNSPELVNEDAFGRGWFIQFTPSDLSELDDLMTPEEYQEHVAKEEEEGGH